MKLLPLLLFPLFLQAQPKPLPLATYFIAGVADGIGDNLQYHYDGNHHYWQPEISWRNKYKNGDPAQGRKFPGSTTWLVWTTDGWHLMKMIRNTTTVATIVLSFGERKKWYYYLMDAAILQVVNRVGFAVGYRMKLK